MSLIKTNDGRLVFMKPESMMVVPYVYDNGVGDYVLGTDVYDISAIIGDSTVVEQSEGNKETKENEFINSPLLEIYSGGKYNFTAQCLDLQNKVLKALFVAMTGVDVEGLAAMEDDFTLRFALIRIRFSGASVSDVVLPKVQLNSRLFIQQLKTRAGQGNIEGTAYSRNIAITNGTNYNLYQFSVNSNGGTTYSPYTPCLFVPKNLNCTVLHHKIDTNTSLHSIVDFESGTVSHNVLANYKNGTWSVYTPNNVGGEGGGSSSGTTTPGEE